MLAEFNWKRGRVVDCTGLENRQRETVREFESHRFRQSTQLLQTSASQKPPTLISLQGSIQTSLVPLQGDLFPGTFVIQVN